MPLILAALLLLGVGHQPHARSAIAAASNRGLAPLACAAATSCDMQFVADDWSGSGNWTSRDSNAWVGIVTGAPTKQATTQFPGRNDIKGFTTGNFFRIAASAQNTLHATDKITYELIFKTPASTSGVAVGVVSATLQQALNLWVLNGNGTVESALYASGVASIYLGTTTWGTAYIASRYYFATVVMDIAAPSYAVYLNGTLVDSADTTTTGSLVAESCGLGIGGQLRDDFGGTGITQAFPGNIVEIVRHRSALSAGTITSRVSQFNGLKGY